MLHYLEGFETFQSRWAGKPTMNHERDIFDNRKIGSSLYPAGMQTVRQFRQLFRFDWLSCINILRGGEKKKQNPQDSHSDIQEQRRSAREREREREYDLSINMLLTYLSYKFTVVLVKVLIFSACVFNREGAKHLTFLPFPVHHQPRSNDYFSVHHHSVILDGITRWTSYISSCIILSIINQHFWASFSCCTHSRRVWGTCK